MTVRDSSIDRPEEALRAGMRLAHPSEEDRVVITGISGTYSECENIAVLSEKLFDKQELVTGDYKNWKHIDPEIPPRLGRIPNVSKFDPGFFGIHYNQAHCMDPMCRIVLEKTVEAIFDAGYNPVDLRGSRTGVFLGSCFCESEKSWFYEKTNSGGIALAGSPRSMLANRISYHLGLNGTSVLIDTACSSSMYALEQAYRAIREGSCESAIVAGCNVCLHPYVSLQFSRLGVLSPEGKCKVFDETADGYCRSEAVCSIFLQKAKNARRVYATVIHGKTNSDGFKGEGITYPSGQSQFKLLDDFYKECAVNPSSVAWIEAHGTGTKVGDPEEVSSLACMFGKNRPEPLLIGSVKSNLGHSEPVSGLCSVTKVIIAMETGLIPPNINFSAPKKDIAQIFDGSVKVITEPTKWDGGLVAINSFGFGGANGHILLSWNEKTKINGGKPDDNLPRLINLSGRTEETLKNFIRFLQSNPVDKELVRLLHDIFKTDVPGYRWKTAIILEKNHISPMKVPTCVFCPSLKPLHIFFPGNFSTFEGIDETLLELPNAKETLLKLSRAVNIDLISASKNGADERNCVSNIVVTTAIQIVLFDAMSKLGVKFNKVSGSLSGKLACAYANGFLTAEETIIASYRCALILSSAIDRSMTVVKIVGSLGTIRDICPTEIEVTQTQNEECLAVGPKLIMNNLLDERSNQLTVIEMKNGGFPLHSTCLQRVSREILYSLKEVLGSNVIIEDLARMFSEPEIDLINEGEGNNIMEIGPVGQHPLKGKSTLNALGSNNLSSYCSFLENLGKLYMSGTLVDPSGLYPPVDYPVSRGTPMIAPHIGWDHSEDWYVCQYEIQGKLASGERIVEVSTSLEDYEYISGHMIDGRNLFPATGYLMLAWSSFAFLKGSSFEILPVVFENIKFLRATNMSKHGAVKFHINIQPISGDFEIVEGGAAIVTGTIYTSESIKNEMVSSEIPAVNSQDNWMTSKDLYKELRLRGYGYSGLFKSISGINMEDQVGIIRWQDNFVAFMDNMLQLKIAFIQNRNLYVPTAIDKLIVDPIYHKSHVENVNGDKVFTAYVDDTLDLIKSGGVEIIGLSAQCITRKKIQSEAVLEKHVFVPNECIIKEFDLHHIMRIIMQRILEDCPTTIVKVFEMEPDGILFSEEINRLLFDFPLVKPSITVLCKTSHPLVQGISQEIAVQDKQLSVDNSTVLVVGSNVLSESRTEDFKHIFNAIQPGRFIVTRESSTTGVKLQPSGIELIAKYKYDNNVILLLKKDTPPYLNPTIVQVKNDDLSWIEEMKNALKSTSETVIVVSENEPMSGILGFMNCLCKEPDGEKVRCFFIMDSDVPKFDLSHPFYAEQARKGLTVNVYSGGKWGSYRHLLLDEMKAKPFPHVQLQLAVSGDLSSFIWVEGPLGNSVCASDTINLANVSYSSLNFKDVMLSTGKIHPESTISDRRLMNTCFGLEYTAVMENTGKRIMGLYKCGSFSTKLLVHPLLAWDVPDNWTLEDAATVPCVYATAMLALIDYGKMKAGDTVLIHAGSGGVGQAAIHLALFYGCTVFTTVGTQEKRDFIVRTFPQLTSENIANSRDISFEQDIMKWTNGRGVDIVLNSLAEEKLLASVRCLAQGGRFIEIGRYDLTNNNQLPIEFIKRGATYQSVMMDMYFDYNENTSYKFWHSFNNLLQSGAVKPLFRTTFNMYEAEKAFRYMAAGKHIGKVLLKINSEEILPSQSNAQCLFLGKPSINCEPNTSYIIAGGLGGFGLELADWLVLRGAQILVLTSRKGVSNGYQKMRIKSWREYGVNVIIATHDITTEEGVERLLREVTEIAPIAGLFNLAVVLKDALFSNQGVENFKASLAGKARATQYFDFYSRKHCHDLKHFVVFSSVSCGRGNTGQTNYGFSNSIMERICEKRKQDGLPGLAIQWGAVGDVGLVADMQEEYKEMVIGGTLQQSIASCLEKMDIFMTQDHPVVSSMVVAEKKYGTQIADNLVDAVINILGLKDLKTISKHSTLAELGLDSMTAVEIKQTMEREFEIFLSPQKIRSLTFADLNEMSANGVSQSDNKSATAENGFDIFMNGMSQVIGNEPRTYEPIVKIHSKSRHPVIFLAPGIEGISIPLQRFGEALNGTVYSIQYDFNNIKKTVQEEVDYLFPIVKKYLHTGAPFIQIGHSFGGLVATNLTQMLEKDGYHGQLVLLDSSPVYLKNYALKLTTGNNLINHKTFLLMLLEGIRPTVLKEAKKHMDETNDWDSLLDILYDLTKDTLNYSKQFQFQMTKSMYCRVAAILTYEELPSKSLTSQVVLIRPSQNFIKGSDDYELSRFCSKEVHVHTVNGNHQTMLDNQELPVVVSRSLVA